MKFLILGDPIAQKRPRFYRSIVYDPCSKEKRKVKSELNETFQRLLNSKNKEIALEALNLTSAEFFDVKVYTYFPITESSTERKRNAKLWGLQKHASKPDLDNLEKFYLDCLTGTIISDDAKISTLSSAKSYSIVPRVEIIVKGYKNNLSDQANGILETFGPDRLVEFLTASYELFDLFARDQDGDWVLDSVGPENATEVKLARTAYLLSALAEIAQKPFQKINRLYPEFYKKAEKVADSIKEKI